MLNFFQYRPLIGISRIGQKFLVISYIEFNKGICQSSCFLLYVCMFSSSCAKQSNRYEINMQKSSVYWFNTIHVIPKIWIRFCEKWGLSSQIMSLNMFFRVLFLKIIPRALTVVESVDIFWPLGAYQNSFCPNQGDNFPPQWSDSMIATGSWSYSIIAIEWANPKQIRIYKIKVMIVLVIYGNNGLVFASSSSWGDQCSIYGAVCFWCTCLVNMSGLVKLQGAVSIEMT